MHQKLSAYYLEYLLSSNKNQAFDVFKSNCTNAIFEVRETLEKHRGWKNILANIMMHVGLLITTAGVGNIIATGYAYYSSPGYKSLLFALTSTDSAKHIQNIEQSIDKLSRI